MERTMTIRWRKHEEGIAIFICGLIVIEVQPIDEEDQDETTGKYVVNLYDENGENIIDFYHHDGDSNYFNTMDQACAYAEDLINH